LDAADVVDHVHSLELQETRRNPLHVIAELPAKIAQKILCGVEVVGRGSSWPSLGLRAVAAINVMMSGA
jgi:hypothetical protein